MSQNGNLPQNSGESQKCSQWLVSGDPLEVQVQHPPMFDRLIGNEFHHVLSPKVYHHPKQLDG